MAKKRLEVVEGVDSVVVVAVTELRNYGITVEFGSYGGCHGNTRKCPVVMVAVPELRCGNGLGGDGGTSFVCFAGKHNGEVGAGLGLKGERAT